MSVPMLSAGHRIIFAAYRHCGIVLSTWVKGTVSESVRDQKECRRAGDRGGYKLLEY